MKTVRIGCGAGFSGDRIEPAVELAARGDLDYLVFECLAERTIALAQLARTRDPDGGYDPWLVERMTAVLPDCVKHGTRIVTNMGAANPHAAATVVRDVARRLGLRGLQIATVTGDDVFDSVRSGKYVVAETGEPVSALDDHLVSANAYLGAEPIVEALAAGADVVITGRVADPSLFLGPLVHTFGWSMEDWPALGRGTLAGHLLECAGQVTGGYFADPGVKDVEGLDRLGFPLAELSDDGTIVITKVAGSGGRVTPAICKEQLLYEVHDPRAYLTPDVVADFSQVRVSEAGVDRVAVSGASGRERPELLKVALGCPDGYIGEGQISYAGPGAVARARLAAEIVSERLPLALSWSMGGPSAVADLRCDLIGLDALHGSRASAMGAEPYEVRLRVAARVASMNMARRIGHEVEALYTNGPAGGGGVTTAARETLAILTTFVPRTLVTAAVHIQVT